MAKQNVWVVGDDAPTRCFLSDFLVSRGFGVVCFESGAQVLRQLPLARGIDRQPALLLLDIGMPGISGIDVLNELTNLTQRPPVIVLSGVHIVHAVVEAMRLGAKDYLIKPLEEGELDAAIRRVLLDHVQSLTVGSMEESPFETSNQRLLDIQPICDRVAQTDAPVFILGESGVGKEVIARYIHLKSGRSPFVKVNCAAVPADLLESEMFGHERGSYTGADREKPGRFEVAADGTIMLDEVGDMNPALQAKLLHVLQDGEFTRLGGLKALTCQARIIAATNKDLQALLEGTDFRRDLFYRLSVVTIEIPPLRERIDDIPTLCAHFVARYGSRYKSRVRCLPNELLEIFMGYSWPGNVRQLENAVRQFLIFPDVRQIAFGLQRTSALQPSLSVQAESESIKELKSRTSSMAEQAEKELILRTLNEVNWNRKEAARRLNMCYKSLRIRLERWNLGSHVKARPTNSAPPP